MRSRTLIQGILPLAFDHCDAVGKAGPAYTPESGEPVHCGNASGEVHGSHTIELVFRDGGVQKIGRIGAVEGDRRLRSNVIFSSNPAISYTPSFSSQLCKKA